MTANPADMTDAPKRPSFDAALEGLRLEGALFVRAEYTEAWGYESLDGPIAASILHPGSRRIILFHLVANGRCWVALSDDGERIWAETGDVIVVPYGDQHGMGGTDEAELVSVATLMNPPPWDVLPTIRHGQGGERTDVVCGYLHSEDPLFDPALRALPPIFVVRPPEGPLARWVASSIDVALEASAPGSNTGMIATKLPELLLIEVLRLHLSTAPAGDRGWMAALRDPVLAPAMALMHNEPEQKWTVGELAAEVAVSRSVLDERFRQVLGRSPIRYLTDWRMHVAKDLLASSDVNVVDVAHRVGYDSEEAFSRAFKRAHGESPTRWRATR